MVGHRHARAAQIPPPNEKSICRCNGEPRVVGGISVSKIEAYGEVYGLEHLRDFAGAYAQARYGFALGRTSTGKLSLQNEKGVIMHLKAKREGLMLSLGGDAVVIEMNQ
jgi:hypothetical protein